MKPGKYVEIGGEFEITLEFSPYFLIEVNRPDQEKTLESLLKREFSGISSIRSITKECLEDPRHISGRLSQYLRVECYTDNDVRQISRAIMVAKQTYEASQDSEQGDPLGNIPGASYGMNDDDFAIDSTLLASFLGDTTESKSSHHKGSKGQPGHKDDSKDSIMKIGSMVSDIREYDVMYLQRVMIELNIRIGKWYEVNVTAEGNFITPIPDIEARPSLKVLAYDIETTKKPLKFPDSNSDSVMMISYMTCGRGYLIVNRAVVSEDIDDFEYTPKNEYVGKFKVWNCPSEEATLLKFLEHCREVSPHIYVTYNGDFFDWPFIERRCQMYGIDMELYIGVFHTSDRREMDRRLEEEMQLKARAKGKEEEDDEVVFGQRMKSKERLREDEEKKEDIRKAEKAFKPKSWSSSALFWQWKESVKSFHELRTTVGLSETSKPPTIPPKR
ncbi:DNA polymerase epsilon catalytic subunit A, partial [Aduncisulcus paluster]